MDAELTQIITLVAHGNYYLHGGPLDFSAISIFPYVSEIKFARYQNNQATEGLDVADSVPAWFAFLRSQKVTRLWNIAFAWQRQDLPEYDAAGFSGGIPRAIQADLPGGFELWYPRWKNNPQDKKTPWSVQYRGLRSANSQAMPAAPLGEIKEHLRRTVSAAESFANRPDVKEKNWAGTFAAALTTLDSPNPPPGARLLPPSGYSLEARQLLAAAAQAYVFGGMGSWNDMGFDKPALQQEYERVTKDLYEAIKTCTVMASNSFKV